MSDASLGQIGLLCIDTQQAFANISLWGRERSNPAFEHNFTSLLAAVRKDMTGKIFHVRHVSTNVASHLYKSAGGGDNIKFMRYAEPLDGEMRLIKTSNSAFVETNLENLILAENIDTLFICGLILDHCVSTTTRMARDLRVAKRIVLVQDATATFDRGEVNAETVHKVSYESLRGEFAEIMDTQTVIGLLKLV